MILLHADQGNNSFCGLCPPLHQDLRLADGVRLGGVPAEDATELAPARADRDVVSIPSVADSIREIHFLLFFDSASSRSATF